MATTFVATNAAATHQARAGVDVTSVVSTYEIAAALIINDVYQMVKVPAGAVICEVILATDDIDSATTLTLSVGDGTTPGRFILESTVGQAGGIVRLSVVNGLGYQYTADDTIDIKCIAAPTSTAITSGTLTLCVMYTMQDDV